jgi:hypothetical protein
MLKKYIKTFLNSSLHCSMMFLGAVINLKQTRIPKTLKLINIVATIIYATWLIAKALCER